MTELLSEMPAHRHSPHAEQTSRLKRSACSCRATISSGPWKHGGIAHTTQLPQRVDTGQDGEEAKQPLTREHCRDAWRSAWGWVMSQLTAYGSESLGRPKLAMLPTTWSGGSIGFVWPSSDNWRSLTCTGPGPQADFDHSNIWWGDNTAEHKKLRMFQECI